MNIRQLRAWIVRLGGVFAREADDKEVTEELESHLQMHMEDNLRAGLAPEEARRQALIKLGGVEQTKEEWRRQRGVPMLEDLWKDLRYGARMMARQPGFTIVAVLTLALGIGANTAIFSVVNSVLLRPLPYQDADRLVWLWDSNPSSGQLRSPSSGPNFDDWRRHSSSFEYMAAFTGWSFNLTGAGEPERLQGVMASPELFPMLGIKPVLGRTFTPEEEGAGSHRVVMISQGLWQRRFGGDPGVLGGPVTLNGESYTIIGVTPPDFRLPYPAEVWTPLALDVLRPGRGSHFISVLARLKPGVSIGQAQADMDDITAELGRQHPGTNTGWGVELQPLHERLVGEAEQALWLLLVAVGLVLLIACVNVANLLLARASTRRKEVAIRTALGAGRARLTRQFLTEVMLVALAGGGCGLLLAYWGVDLLVALNPRDLPRAEEVGLDSRVLCFTLAVSVLTGLGFGLVPAVLGSKVDLHESLKEGSRSATTGRRRGRVQGLLVVSEIALAVVLLVGAGLMVKSLLRLTEVDLGFDPEGVLTMHISLPQAKYSERESQAAFYEVLLQRVRNLPGVQAAGTVSPLPLTGGSNQEIFVEGRPLPVPNQGYITNLQLCSPDYFGAMRIPLMKGRFFDERDTDKSRPIVIINETFARRFWPDEDPLGKRISFSGPEGSWSEIVGVARDTRHQRLDSEVGLQTYRPYSQSPIPYAALVTKLNSDPSALASSIKREVLGLDASLPVYSVRPMREVISRTLAPRRLQMTVLGVFAAIALTLAAVGIYGVMSYTVSQRAHEIRIRMALGAQVGDVVKLVIGQGMRLALSGLVLGLVCAFGLTRLIESLLFGVSATDPLTYIEIAFLLTAVAFTACYLPARRATRVDQLVSMRYE
jgi:predicted permease